MVLQFSQSGRLPYGDAGDHKLGIFFSAALRCLRIRTIKPLALRLPGEGFLRLLRRDRRTGVFFLWAGLMQSSLNGPYYHLSDLASLNRWATMPFAFIVWLWGWG